MTERSRIGMPETGIGFVPDVGGTWLLSRAPGELGTYLALTAGFVDAGDAIVLGLADHFVLADDLPFLVDRLVDGPAESVLAELARPQPQSALASERGWIDDAFGCDEVGDIFDALEAMAEPAASRALDALRTKSPTSLAVTLRALRSAARMDRLEDALVQEYRIAVRLLRGYDLAEGIRAQVIDKDRAPRWSPAAVRDVDQAFVEALLAPLGDEDLRLNRPIAAAGQQFTGMEL